MFKNTDLEYGSVSKFLHWLLIITLVVMFCIGFFNDDISDKALAGVLMRFHKSLGLCLLAIMIVMLLWRGMNPKPQWPTDMPQWERLLAHLTHSLIYLLLILMPVAGWIMTTAANRSPVFFGLFTIKAPFISPNKTLAQVAGELHEIIAWTLLALIALHILGALKHYFIDKNTILQRMCCK